MLSILVYETQHDRKVDRHCELFIFTDKNEHAHAKLNIGVQISLQNTQTRLHNNWV